MSLVCALDISGEESPENTIFDKIILRLEELKSSKTTLQLNLELMEMLLDREALQAFFLNFLSGDFLEILNGHQINNASYIPSTLDEFKSVSRYRTPKTQGLTTRVGTHPLNEKEYSLARAYLSRHPQMVSAFMVLESGLTSYLDELEKTMNQTVGVPKRVSYDGKTTTIFDILKSGLTSRGVMQEFLPLHAYNAYLLELDGETCPGKQQERTLKDAFTDRRAFTSSDSNRIINCPFRKMIGQLLSTQIEVAEDNKLRIQPSSKSGSLISFISEHLRPKLKQPACLIKEQKDGQTP